MSLGPPAAKPTTQCTGFAGYLSAATAAVRGERKPSSRARTARITGPSGGLDPDRAAHAGAAEAAIARRVLGQILLVVVLGEIERRRIEDLGGDGVEAPRFQFLLIHRLRRLGGFALGGREGIDAGAVLRAHVVALAQTLGRVVALPEGAQQLLVGHL